MDVHVPTSWSGSVHSDAAFYCTSSQDNNSAHIESMDSINSVESAAASAASEVVVNNSDSLLSLEESKRQTKFLEELLNYSESASLDSQGNSTSRAALPEYSYHYHHTIIDNTISGQTDWAHADSASIAQERVNHPDNNLVNGVLGFLLACGCPGNGLRRSDVRQQQQHHQQQPESQREPDVFEKIALLGHEGDLLDKIFSGFESAVCTEGNKGPVDRRENRILGAARHVVAAAATAAATATSPRISKAMVYSVTTTQASTTATSAATAAIPKKSSGSDILDNVFESMETMVCRDDLGEYARGAIPTNQARVVNYDDMLDHVFHGVETLVCQDGPRDPPAHHRRRQLGSERSPPPEPRDDYVTNYVRTHRGDWRAVQPGEYSFDRDNSIISEEAGVNSRVSEPRPWNGRGPPPPHQNHHQPQPMVKHGDAYLQSNFGGGGAAAAKSSQNHRDMLDFVFDGVETMVCNDDDDDRYIGNHASQFDEDLPLKRFHWDDE
jgi:hypothetical protein